MFGSNVFAGAYFAQGPATLTGPQILFMAAIFEARSSDVSFTGRSAGVTFETLAAAVTFAPLLLE